MYTENGVNFEKLITRDSLSGTGNYSYVSAIGLLYQIEISNDDEAIDMTYTVDGKTFTVKPFESSIETFISFSDFSIAATGKWRAIVRGY